VTFEGRVLASVNLRLAGAAYGLLEIAARCVGKGKVGKLVSMTNQLSLLWMFTSVSGRATTRSNIGLFQRNGPGFREASN